MLADCWQKILLMLADCWLALSNNLLTTMATFKALVLSDGKRADGTYNVKIRVTHNRQSLRVATSMYVKSEQMTRSLKFKDQRIIDACDSIISEWRGIVADLGTTADALSCSDLVEYLRSKTRDAKGFRLDFIAYIRRFAERKAKHNTKASYLTLANALTRYTEGKTLDISEVKVSFLQGFEDWMRKEEIAAGTMHLYMSVLKAAHNAAKLEYNDEDNGEVRIPGSPFLRYKIPQAPLPEPRAIDLATLQRIADLDDENAVNSLRNLGRDLFMLSFALGGINAVDLYDLPYSAYKGDYIEYNRKKTQHSRIDKAYYRVAIVPEVRPLLERYLDPTKKRLFRFHLRYCNSNTFLARVPSSVKAVAQVVKFSREYTYYSARHTYATLARNACAIDMYTVHELLNHSDQKMKITDRYIERDWQRLFDAHAKVVKLVDWTKISKN